MLYIGVCYLVWQTTRLLAVVNATLSGGTALALLYMLCLGICEAPTPDSPDAESVPPCSRLVITSALERVPSLWPLSCHMSSQAVCLPCKFGWFCSKPGRNGCMVFLVRHHESDAKESIS